MVTRISAALRRIGGGVAAAALTVSALTVSVLPVPVMAQAVDLTDPTTAERYLPGIWIDPDGCEHWVMDDGSEGYMDNRLTRDGRPVCHRDVCGVIRSDTLFPSGGASISASARASLENFFRDAEARSFIITGHTDSQGSDEYNLRLSQRRATAVASVASGVGRPVLSVSGQGMRFPAASNSTAEGMAQNRRVEVICVK